MRIESTSPLSRPTIVNVIIFDPWPFKEPIVLTTLGYLSTYFNAELFDGPGYYLAEERDNALILLSDGTVVVGSEEAVDTYRNKL